MTDSSAAGDRRFPTNFSPPVTSKPPHRASGAGNGSPFSSDDQPPACTSPFNTLHTVLLEWEYQARLGVSAFASGDVNASARLHQDALSLINNFANMILTEQPSGRPLADYDRLFAAVTVTHINLADCYAAAGRTRGTGIVTTATHRVQIFADLGQLLSE